MDIEITGMCDPVRSFMRIDYDRIEHVDVDELETHEPPREMPIDDPRHRPIRRVRVR